ncbi:MAG: metal-dependent transcriptional regulator [Eubacteriales bacterium]|nr:metal-dependent transcriptional regulator [Eubacteriales bacterium]
MNIYESAEDYLERILMIQLKKGFVKSIDVAKELNVSKPSVSFAMKQLCEHDYITMDEGKHIHLTPKGREIAERIYERHVLISKVLLKIGVSEENAYKDACKMEHDISDETYAIFKKFAEQDA